jgi:hypothetical protein
MYSIIAQEDHILISSRFRWSALQLSSLKRLRSTTPNAISQALQKLPKDLNETYERILSSIDEYSMSSAVKSLKWLVVSKRTLYMEELADAVSDELRDLEQTPYEFRDVVPEPFHLVEMLGDLIQVQPALHDNSSYKPRQHKIVLAHFSVQEFLLKDYIKTSSLASHKIVWSICTASIANHVGSIVSSGTFLISRSKSTLGTIGKSTCYLLKLE